MGVDTDPVENLDKVAGRPLLLCGHPKSGTSLLLWVQDFNLGGVAYAEAEVRAQIDAAQAVGVSNFILWDPDVTYHFDALIGLPSPEGD